MRNTNNRRIPALRRAVLGSILATSSAAGTAGAQSYEAEVIAADLASPTGIAVTSHGDLYFTQLPTPGVPGDEGGMNMVSHRDAKSGEITNITVGEPEPTFIAVSPAGNIYWTCKSAGVILRHVKGKTSLVIDGLNQPSGINARFCAPDDCTLYITQLPTPGVPGDDGGMNTVDALVNGELMNITLGEPEPTQIVATDDGTLYWTCKSAGVILTRDGKSGEVGLLLGELNQPTGIALDAVGNLYFTEVPTPGMPGDEGGENRVLKYNLDSQQLFVINDGDPDPVDVAVSANGRHVYWTCRVAGVIVRADLDTVAGDLNGDGAVDATDLMLLLAAWGSCPEGEQGTCIGDVNDDGIVDGSDLLILLSNWG